jgi:carbonic anhydrase
MYKQQSPIQLQHVLEQTSMQLNFFKLTTPLQISQRVMNEDSLKLVGSGAMTVQGKLWQFKNIHFHNPNEHKDYNNKTHAMEAHLLFEAGAALMVIALWLDVGKTDDFLAAYLTEKDEAVIKQPLKMPMNWVEHGRVVAYVGSLTTPPYAENVQWYVITNPALSVTETVLKQYQRAFPKETRRALRSKNDEPVAAIIY